MNVNPMLNTSGLNIKSFLTLIILLKTGNQGMSSLIVGAFVCELWIWNPFIDSSGIISMLLIK